MSELTVVPDAPSEGFYCPGCGTKYDTPGICTGPVESGHQPLAVVPVTDEEATMEASKVGGADAPAPDAAALEGVYNEPFDPVKAGVPTNAQFSDLLSRVSSLESSLGGAQTAFKQLAGTTDDRLGAVEARVAALEAASAPDEQAKVPAAPEPPAAPVEAPAAPATGFTPTPAPGEGPVAPEGGWPTS